MHEELLLLYITLYVLCFCGSSFAVEPDATACLVDQELSFFCGAKQYKDAKESCAETYSYLVKVDNANMTEAVNSLIDEVECPYANNIFIGGIAEHHPNFPSDGSKRIWTWLDGSAIHLVDLNGYNNWLPGQPNDFGGREDCLLIEKETRQWKDSPCSGLREEKHYICQKKTKISIRVDSTLNGRRCSALAGSCVLNTEWRRDDVIVSSKNSTNVYQISSIDSSLLHYENATIRDAGKYVCVAWIDGDKANPEFTTVFISVNGTPEVVDIKSFSCNASLYVVWKPNFRSVGFLHRITATAYLAEKHEKSIDVTPENAFAHFTEIARLRRSTEYHVKVVACKDMNDCSNEYSVSQNATTLGRIVGVTNASIRQDINETGNITCVVTWDSNISATFQVNITFSSSKTLEDKTTEQINITGKENYSFHPISERVYEVEIQPVTNEKYCPKPVKANGSCFKKKDQNDENKPEQTKKTDLMFIIIPAAAVGAVFVLSIAGYCLNKGMKDTRQQTDGLTTDPNRGATDYGHLHSSSKEVDTEGNNPTPNDQVAYASAEDPQSSSNAPIYASVYNSKIKTVVKENSNDETEETTPPKPNKAAAQPVDMMVVNPIYDMEASTSTEQPTTSEETVVREVAPGASAVEDLQFVSEDPIYTAVNKVKMKRKRKDDD